MECCGAAGQGRVNNRWNIFLTNERKTTAVMMLIMPEPQKLNCGFKNQSSELTEANFLCRGEVKLQNDHSELLTASQCLHSFLQMCLLSHRANLVTVHCFSYDPDRPVLPAKQQSSLLTAESLAPSQLCVIITGVKN
ncbi:hypothetical protein XENOCAPTIV_009769 [Xenoophorus captivus]|uniref:Uncharacterized protein n=1 Tax=Xenoophorus captivus TaxID=1517983 RepID=A0ABV0R0V2_9TELE